jgi:hypothetical protein
MKIKLQEYGIISIKMINGMINELEGFKTGDILKDLPTRSLIGTLEGLKQQIIPAEISDEEALKLTKEMNKQPMVFVPNEISDEDIKRGIKREYLFSNSEEKRLMIEGAMWYKEQLKRNK